MFVIASSMCAHVYVYYTTCSQRALHVLHNACVNAVCYMSKVCNGRLFLA